MNAVLAESNHADCAQQLTSPQRFTLSVLLLAYNQERYIGQALQSALAQQTDFEFEIVVGDDASSDRTPLVVEEYCRRHPDRIRLLRSCENVGVTRNFLRTYAQCRGQFIAILEADDYWTDRSKLQRQVDLLLARPEVTCCFHQVELLRDDASSHFLEAPFSDCELTLREVIRRNPVCNCSTVVFRNRLVSQFPNWFAKGKYYDWPLHALHAAQGPIAYIARTMSHYRVHSGGAWHGADPTRRAAAVLRLLRRLERHLGEGYETEFQAVIAQWRRVLRDERNQRFAKPGFARRLVRGASRRLARYSGLTEIINQIATISRRRARRKRTFLQRPQAAG